MKPPVPPRILPVAETDLPAIARLAGVIWPECYAGIISREQIEFMLARMYSLDVLRDEISAQGIRFYRLVVDGREKGFASIGPLKTPGVWKLHKIYLCPEIHGRGLGSRMLQHCQSEAWRFGARRLILSVNKRNTRAITAYQRNGFAVTESVVVDIGRGFVMDDFVMAKDLAGGVNGLKTDSGMTVMTPPKA
jgi:GNAT superfamily N-acetyltransferase